MELISEHAKAEIEQMTAEMEIWVAEYSHSQDAFHRQPLKTVLSINLVKFAKGEPNDWVPFAVGTPAQVDRAISIAKRIRDRLSAGIE
jgi:hypothetical protein